MRRMAMAIAMLASIVLVSAGCAEPMLASIEADIADARVAEFVPGTDDGSAQFNPGVRPIAVGETAVTLSERDTGDVLAEFVMRVTE